MPSSHPSPSSRLPFSGTSAVVTGSSSGIGKAVAVELANGGIDNLVIHFNSNRAGAEATANRARQSGCDQVSVIQADLAKPAARLSLVSEAFQKLGHIDSWVNCAGGDVLTGEAASWDFPQKLDHLWNIDVRGTIELSRQVALRMKTQSSSRTCPSITFIGWDQAPQGMEGDAGQMFGPIKAAVMAFANSMALEHAPEIRVNTVAPGWIKTAWGQSTNEYWDKRAKCQSLMGRWGNGEDVARAVMYVADPANSFTTGQTINVNGGWNRRYDDPEST